MKRYIIGIDPGKNGGISVYDTDNDKVVDSIKMPPTQIDIYNFLFNYSNDSLCYVEKVGGLPGMSGSGMFNFGYDYGCLITMLWALKIPTNQVTPQKWMKNLQLGTSKGMGKTEWKNKLKQKAVTLYPDVKVTLSNSDSLLIMKYGICQEKANL